MVEILTGDRIIATQIGATHTTGYAVIVGSIVQRYLLISSSSHFLSILLLLNHYFPPQKYQQTKSRRTADSRGFVVLCKTNLVSLKVTLTGTLTHRYFDTSIISISIKPTRHCQGTDKRDIKQR